VPDDDMDWITCSRIILRLFLTMNYLVEAQGNQRRSRIRVRFGLIVSELKSGAIDPFVLSAYDLGKISKCLL
jgi:hypothetical protein